MDTTIVLKVGDPAPDFHLKDHRNRDVILSQLRGRRILLSWHPLAWTNVCAEQMKSLETRRKALGELNTIAMGLSVDSVPCKNAWARHIEVSGTALLSDFWPHGGTARDYGLFLEDKGFSARANLVVNENGTIIFIKLYDIPQLPDIEEVVSFLKGHARA